MDDAVQESSYKIYMDLLNEFENPNGCKIKATFFVSHLKTEYKYVKELANLGRNKFPHTSIIFIKIISKFSSHLYILLGTCSFLNNIKNTRKWGQT